MSNRLAAIDLYLEAAHRLLSQPTLDPLALTHAIVSAKHEVALASALWRQTGAEP